MIENDKQLDVTKAAAARFDKSIETMRRSERPSDIDPVLWQAQLNGMESMRDTLRSEIAEYLSRRSVE